MRDSGDSSGTRDLLEYPFRFVRVRQRFRTIAEDMHAFPAVIFQSWNDEQALIGKRFALVAVGCEFLLVEILGMVIHADKLTTARTERGAQLSQRKLTIRVGAVNVEHTSKHGSCPRRHRSFLPSAARPSREVPEASHRVPEEDRRDGNYHGRCLSREC